VIENIHPVRKNRLLGGTLARGIFREFSADELFNTPVCY
jgi:hypothetical protein